SRTGWQVCPSPQPASRDLEVRRVDFRAQPPVDVRLCESPENLSRSRALHHPLDREAGLRIQPQGNKALHLLVPRVALKLAPLGCGITQFFLPPQLELGGGSVRPPLVIPDVLRQCPAGQVRQQEHGNSFTRE